MRTQSERTSVYFSITTRQSTEPDLRWTFLYPCATIRRPHTVAVNSVLRRIRTIRAIADPARQESVGRREIHADAYGRRRRLAHVTCCSGYARILRSLVKTVILDYKTQFYARCYRVARFRKGARRYIILINQRCCRRYCCFIRKFIAVLHYLLFPFFLCISRKEYDIGTAVFCYTLNKWQNCNYS